MENGKLTRRFTVVWVAIGTPLRLGKVQMSYTAG